jgi:exopolysaccharide production protein ExoQ
MSLMHNSRAANTRSFAENLTIVLCFAFFMFIIVGISPYSSREVSSSIDLEGEGSALRQIVLIIIFALSLPLMAARRTELKALASATPFFVILTLWCWASSTWAISPDTSSRRIFASTLVILMAMFATTLPARKQVNLLALMLGAIVGLDYLGIIAFHGGSVHTEGGNWKGFHSHKNVAGYFCVIATVVFTHMAWFHRNKAFYLLAAASFIFLVFTISKTSLGLLAVIMFASYFYRRSFMHGVDSRMVMLLAAMGMVCLVPIAYAVLAMISSGEIDLTLTGRTEIWQFVIGKASEAPFLGWGYGSFWGIGDLTPALNEADLSIASLPHAHNGYLDVLVSTGSIGLFFTLSALAMPFLQFIYMPIGNLTADEREAGLYGMVMLTFGILHNLTETSLLQGLVPMWPFMLLGLYMVASTYVAAAKRGREANNG